jgi:hypothetical protein
MLRLSRLINIIFLFLLTPKTHLYIYARGSACCFSDEALAYIKLGQPELALPNLQKAQKIIDSGKWLVKIKEPKNHY